MDLQSTFMGPQSEINIGFTYSVVHAEQKDAGTPVKPQIQQEGWSLYGYYQTVTNRQG
jgi:hypothetical protein